MSTTTNKEVTNEINLMKEKKSVPSLIIERKRRKVHFFFFSFACNTFFRKVGMKN